MAQRLIVEGNDAIALSVLCQKNGLNPPIGYDQPTKFKNEFIVGGGSYAGALKRFQLSLTEPNLQNIGLIVDADDKGPLARWQSIRSILAALYDPATLLNADAQPGYKIISETYLPTVGIWIMPDNTQNGYLEHFLASLIPVATPLWSHAHNTVENLLTESFNEITQVTKQKSLLHTWLAWKDSPGKPFGQAMHSGYFDHTAPVAKAFMQWFATTFQLVS